MNGTVSSLTDGTGVSPGTWTKFIKDFVADFLLTAAAGLGAGVTLDTFDLGSIIAAPDLAGIAIGGALIRALFRAVLRWAQT